MSIIDKLNNVFFKKSQIPAVIEQNTKRVSLGQYGEIIDYATGLKVLSDPQVRTGFDVLRYILASKEWMLVNNDNQEYYDFINDMLLNMDVEINEVIKRMLTALLWGFSASELIYEINLDGKLVVKTIEPIHIKTLQKNPFIFDNKKELKALHQDWDGEQVDIPVNKVLLYSFNDDYNDFYGNGLLNDFKPIVEDKLNINNWLMTFLERHESPTLYAKLNGSSYDRERIIEAFSQIKDGTSGIVIDAEDDVGTLESQHRGETFFSTLQYKDNQIFRRYYLGNLLLGDNSQTGTYAQSQTQLDFGLLVFDGILEELANCIQKQIINPLILFNYENLEGVPTFKFDKFNSGDIHKLMATISPLITNGIIDYDNTTVQDSISQLFKQETGLTYIPNEFEEEQFIQDTTIDETENNNNLLDDLNV